MWHDIIGATHKEGVGAALWGNKRARLAIEGVARDTISLGIEELSKLDL